MNELNSTKVVVNSLIGKASECVDKTYFYTRYYAVAWSFSLSMQFPKSLSYSIQKTVTGSSKIGGTKVRKRDVGNLRTKREKSFLIRPCL